MHFDTLETRDPEVRERDVFAALRRRSRTPKPTLPRTLACSTASIPSR